MDLTQQIKSKAFELGFDLAGVTDASPISDRQKEYFLDWLEKDCPVDMHYMHRNVQKRMDPGRLLPGAKSVICVALNYRPAENTAPEPAKDREKGRVADYAIYPDYHHFIKERLYRLAEFIRNLTGKNLPFKVCVDSAPVAERTLAARAGLGFIGKSHMLIHPKLGPELLLGEIITELELEPDSPLQDGCSGCDKCIEACPTGALDKKGGFHAEKCISYLTIEHKNAIPQQLQPALDRRLFGCDRCITACPYNKGPAQRSTDFKIYPKRKWLDLREILQWDGRSFQKHLGESPMTYCGLDKLKENAEVCLRNIQRARIQGARKTSSSDDGTSRP